MLSLWWMRRDEQSLPARYSGPAKRKAHLSGHRIRGCWEVDGEPKGQTHRQRRGNEDIGCPLTGAPLDIPPKQCLKISHFSIKKTFLQNEFGFYLLCKTNKRLWQSAQS